MKRNASYDLEKHQNTLESPTLLLEDGLILENSNIKDCPLDKESLILKKKIIIKKKESRFDILYSRVSSHKQEDDLQRQKQYLEENCQTKEFTHIQDIASGLNFKRKGLIKILDSVKEGKVRTIIVASKDRMARFGFDLIEWLCHEYGTKILVLDNQNQSPTEELGKDLLSIVQIYCCRWNGKRRYKNICVCRR